MDHQIKKPARLQRLHALSIQVRQIAIGRLDDLQATCCAMQRRRRRQTKRNVN
jgi:hypothetical protein